MMCSYFGSVWFTKAEKRVPPACSGVASHISQPSERPEHGVSVREVIETELDSRIVAVMNHCNLRGD